LFPPAAAVLARPTRVKRQERQEQQADERRDVDEGIAVKTGEERCNY